MRHLQKLGFFIMLLSVALPLSAFDNSQKAFNYLKKQQTASIEKSLTQEEKILLKEIQAAETEDITTFLEEVSFFSNLTPQERKQRILKLAQKIQNGFKKSKSPFYKDPLAFIKKYKKTSIGIGIFLFLFLLPFFILRQSSLQEKWIFMGGYSDFYEIKGKNLSPEEAEKKVGLARKIREQIDKNEIKNLSIETKPYKTEDGTTLYGSYFKNLQNEKPIKNRKVILYYHTTSGNIFSEYPMGRDIVEITGCDLFIASYPGYGINEGKITSPEIFYGAAESSFKCVTSQDGLNYKQGNTILFGASLGCAPAVHIASKYNPAALCLAAPFLSLPEQAPEFLTLLLGLPNFLKSIKPILRALLRYTMNNAKKIKNVRCPIFIGHSTNDNFIPFSQGEKLHKIAKDEGKTTKFFARELGPHFIVKPIIHEMKKFIDELFPKKAS